MVESRRRAAGVTNAVLLDRDYEEALEEGRTAVRGIPVGCYFIDGPHDYRSQLMCLWLAQPILSDHAVIVVDDCNYEHVRQANRDFLLVAPEWKLAFEAYTRCHPQHMNETQAVLARKGWWNGVNVLVRDPEDALPRTYPPTCRNRTLYENEHLIHGARLGSVAPQAVYLADALTRLNPLATAKHLLGLGRAILRAKRSGTLTFAVANTSSERLPDVRLNPGLGVPRLPGLAG